MFDEKSCRVLILGGTSEANTLASQLVTQAPHLDIILSLAGRTRDPELPDVVAVRSGGFGGAEGLATYLKAERITVLIDATHPFARQIAENAVNAAHMADVPHAKLLRPPWKQKTGDQWLIVADEMEAASALPSGSHPFIALGRQHLSPFAGRYDLKPVLRMIEPPDLPLDIPAEIIRGRPGASAKAEANLFRAHRITHLVCRNSGGERSYAKIEAAKTLGIPVVMIVRPVLRGVQFTLESVDACVAWVLEHTPRNVSFVR
ncbi:cobalt-precorrin-6A reductase [Fulvimarina sp. MAC8]|uniref:cobalt-precorrin-6A reductase n=1 Tax=Fulvimarina sp. MAC8 TaxID=3162874 RepID=UPI0032EC1B97